MRRPHRAGCPASGYRDPERRELPSRARTPRGRTRIHVPPKRARCQPARDSSRCNTAHRSPPSRTAPVRAFGERHLASTGFRIVHISIVHVAAVKTYRPCSQNTVGRGTTTGRKRQRAPGLASMQSASSDSRVRNGAMGHPNLAGPSARAELPRVGSNRVEFIDPWLRGAAPKSEFGRWRKVMEMAR